MKNKPSITLITMAIAMPLAALAFGLFWSTVLGAVLLVLSNHSLRPRLSWPVTLAFLCLMPFMASAATDGSAASTVSPSSPSWLSALIPVLVPISIAGLKMLLPKLPSWTLPTIVAPTVGLLADLALHYAGVPTLGPAWGAILGSAGVGLREIQDQVKQRVAPATA